MPVFLLDLHTEGGVSVWKIRVDLVILLAHMSPSFLHYRAIESVNPSGETRCTERVPSPTYKGLEPPPVP
jgi:hypothetical protein